MYERTRESTTWFLALAILPVLGVAAFDGAIYWRWDLRGIDGGAYLFLAFFNAAAIALSLGGLIWFAHHAVQHCEKCGKRSRGQFCANCGKATP